MDPQFVCNQDDREVWLEARRTGIGGSDCPAVLGISPFETEASLAQKKGGLVPDKSETGLMRYGRHLERPMLEDFLDEMNAGSGLEPPWMGELSGSLYRNGNPDRDFMLATVDCRVVKPSGEVGIGEMKLKRFGADEWRQEGVPDYVVAQAQHTMEVVDVDFAFVIVLLDPFELQWKELARDRELLNDVIVPAERIWWQKFQDGEAFDFTKGRAVDANAKVLKQLHPKDSGETIELEGDEALKLLQTWAFARLRRIEAEKHEKAMKNGLLVLIGDATFARFDNGSMLSYKTIETAGYQVKAKSYRKLYEMAAKGRR